MMADTPTAAAQQLDVHFQLQKTEKRFRFKSILWNNKFNIWSKTEFEEMNNYLMVRHKKSFACLYMDKNTLEVSLSLDKTHRSVFRVVKLKQVIIPQDLIREHNNTNNNNNNNDQNNENEEKL
jgi:hypothetical protein